ncbi:MAG: alpha/beta hydrolase [Shewanellaceae bacterium]|nr:alpha/beta hydrolase [Shewanellaceae bacterium]
MSNRPQNYLKREAFQCHYEIVGEGEPLLIIGSVQYYQPLFARLALPNIQCIFFDQRTHAIPTAPTQAADYTIDRITADIEALRCHLKLPTWSVFGHSGHALLAMAYARAHPNHVQRLLLCAISPDLSPATFAAADAHWTTTASAARQQHWAQQMAQLPADLQADPEQIMQHICRRMGARRWYDYRFDEQALWDKVHVNATGFASLWQDQFKQPAQVADGHRFTMPTWLSWGRYDFSYPSIDCWEPYRIQFNDWNQTIFERSGHTPFYEEPAAFNQALLNWFQS